MVNLLKYLSVDNLYTFGQSFINKHLKMFILIECPDTNNKKCKFGWIINDEQDQYQNIIELNVNQTSITK